MSRVADIEKLCNALSDHYGEEVVYSSKSFWINENSGVDRCSADFELSFRDITNGVENYHDLGGNPYPPHIVKMIDKFYNRDYQENMIDISIDVQKQDNISITTESVETCKHDVEVSETSSQVVTYCTKCGGILHIKNKPSLIG